MPLFTMVFKIIFCCMHLILGRTYLFLTNSQVITNNHFDTNTTQITQPLDKGVFVPLKSAWKDVCHEKTPGKWITHYEFSKFLSKALIKYNDDIRDDELDRIVSQFFTNILSKFFR